MTQLQNITNAVPKDVRFIPAVFGLLVLAVLLLFVDDMPLAYQKGLQPLIPSLAIYTIGAAMLAAVQAMMRFRAAYKAQAAGHQDPGVTSNIAFALIVIRHVVWAAALVAYSIWKAVL